MLRVVAGGNAGRPTRVRAMPEAYALPDIGAPAWRASVQPGMCLFAGISCRPTPFVPLSMEQPTRIDLLELDIDLRLADLWREAADVTEWNLEVVSAFMRAAYGKGYCDAFTEDRRARCATTTGTRSRVSSAPCARSRSNRCRGSRAVGRLRVSSDRGQEAVSGSTRHRPLDRGGARSLPPLHLDSRWRNAVAQAEPARRPSQGRCRSSAGSSASRRGLACRRPALRAAGCRRIRRARRSRSSTRAASPTLPDRP